MSLFSQMRMPLVVAPMFLVSSPELVIAAARSGVIGGLPGPNARSLDSLGDWMAKIHEALAPESLPWLFNMIVHPTYDRFDGEVELVKRYRPAIVSTALGSPARVIDAVKSYGGLVYADVITPEMARKSVVAGVDALILVTQGAGGHTGRYHPLAFIAEVREFWDGPVGIAGCISRGDDVAAMLVAGADFVVAGTRFIGTDESFASPGYKTMLTESSINDIVESKTITGVTANWMKRSLEQAEVSLDAQPQEASVDFSGDVGSGDKAWKDVWSAGQGVGVIKHTQPCQAIVDQMVAEFDQAIGRAASLQS